MKSKFELNKVYLLNFTKSDGKQRTMVAHVTDFTDTHLYVTDVEVMEPRTVRIDSLQTSHPMKVKDVSVAQRITMKPEAPVAPVKPSAKYSFKREGGQYVVKHLDRVVGKAYTLTQVERMIQVDMQYKGEK